MSTPPRKLSNLTEHSYVPQWAREQPELSNSQLRPADADAHDSTALPHMSNHSVARSGLVPDANFTRGVTEPSLPLQGMTSTEDIGEKSARPQDEIVDLDLERLETALRSLQREATVARLRSPPPLKSEGMPSPARAPRHALRWLSVLIVAGSVAPLAYYFSADSLVSASTRVLPSQPETFQLRFEVPRPVEQKGPIGSRDHDRGTSIVPSISPRQADVPSAAPAPAVETVGLRAPQPAAVEASRPDTPGRVLDREKIALLMTQGEQLMSAGDIAAARTVFQRASEAGDAVATVALAASYDPTALKRLGVVGKHADLAKARSLYEKAESLGSEEATRRLHMLARQ